jgi:hypothetical protein
VDFSKFRAGDWLLVAGGAVMLVFGLALHWTTVDTPLGSGSGDNAFTYFFTGGIAWLLTVAAGVVAFLLAGRIIDAGTTPWSLILLGATGLATLLMLLRLLLGPRDDIDVQGVDVGRGAGMFVAFIAAAVALTGAVMNYRSSGGNLKDLTDIDKLRRAFNRPDRGSSIPPPPPPPSGGQAPPPPPPPPAP